MALWTPSEDSGSMNSPASPTSKKRASPNCVAVYKVASAAWGVGSDSGSRQQPGYVGGFAQLGTVDLGQAGPPDISPGLPIDQQGHVPQPGVQGQRPYDAVGIGFDQGVAAFNAPRLSHVPPIGGQSQGLKAAVASAQPLAGPAGRCGRSHRQKRLR